MEGVSKSRKPLLEEGEQFDVTLFTVRPDKKRQYVAVIREVECLTDSQAAGALAIFEKNGWLRMMREDVRKIDGKTKILKKTVTPTFIVNMRFKMADVYRYPDDTFALEGDPILSWNRYQLFHAKPGIRKAQRSTRKGSEEAPSGGGYERRGADSTHVNEYHKEMQKILLAQVKAELSEHRVTAEEGFVDVRAESESDLWLFEVKTDDNPREVMRYAIGQLLEYANYNKNAIRKTLHLVAVGQRKLTATDESYLQYLRQHYALPLTYRVVELP